jgi:hypothetical protein
MPPDAAGCPLGFLVVIRRSVGGFLPDPLRNTTTTTHHRNPMGFLRKPQGKP